VFYNDTREPKEVKQHNKARRRQNKVESDPQYQQRLREWEAQNPPEIELKPKGNSMTEAFYSQCVLPIHINRIKQLEERYDRRFYLQEDNDPSHGTRSDHNVAASKKRKLGITTLRHSPNSPDLSPIESIWNIIVGRLRGGSWQIVTEFKAAIKAEWDKVTLAQARKRIPKMP
jgi:hypothetical protein